MAEDMQIEVVVVLIVVIVVVIVGVIVIVVFVIDRKEGQGFLESFAFEVPRAFVGQWVFVYCHWSWRH